jgi:RNA polymerase sigma factor (TIGR02999 family)
LNKRAIKMVDLKKNFEKKLGRMAILGGMSDVTQILSEMERGDPQAAEKLLPLVYEELRKLAAARLAQEKPGQTLQATALVHEAYVRLVGGGQESGIRDQGSEKRWDGRGHFFGAAAEAMRRILTDAARRKQTVKHGGEARRADGEVEMVALAPVRDVVETLAVHELLDRLAENHGRKAEVVKLRYFLGCTQEEAAEILGITPAMAQEDWAFARAWLKREWRKGEAL